jgi:hypothetical protein
MAVRQRDSRHFSWSMSCGAFMIVSDQVLLT